MRVLHFKYFSVICAFALASVGCDKHEPVKPRRFPGQQSEATVATHQQVGKDLPAEYYDGLVFWQLEHGIHEVLSPERTKQSILLDFDGAIVKTGAEPGKSLLICGKQRSVKSSGLSSADQAAVKAGVKAYFERDGANIKVITSKREASLQDTTTIYFTDNTSELGCNPQTDLPYAAPLDAGNLSKFDSGFVFGDKAKDVPTLIENTIAAINQTFGVEQANAAQNVWDEVLAVVGLAAELKDNLDDLSGSGELPTSNPSYSHSGPKISTEGLSLGNYTKQLQGLPGAKFIAAIGSTLPEVSSDSAIATADIEQLVAKALPSGVSTPGLNRVVTIVEISNLAAKKRAEEDAGVGNEDRAQDSRQDILTPANIKAIGGLAAVAALAGYGSLPLAIAAASQIYDGQPSQATSSEKFDRGASPDRDSKVAAGIQALPDFAAMLEINDFTDLNELFNRLRAHVYLVNQNYSGEDRAALLSMLKIGYGQIYYDQLRARLIFDKR